MADVQRHYNFADLFELAADKVPDRTALIDKRREINFRDLDERSTRFAHALLDAGVKAGDHVGILATNCIEWVEAMYGVYKIRARVVNVNFRYVEEEMRYLFDNSDMVALVYQREYAPIVIAARDAQPKLKTFFRIEWDDSDADDTLEPIEFEAAIASGSPDRDFSERSDDDVYLLYTGGTTGMPKGVMWRQEDVYFALGGGIDALTGERVTSPFDASNKINTDVPDGMVSLPIPPLMHGAGQFSIFRATCEGNTAVIVDKFDAEETWRLVEKYKINMIGVTGDAMARPLAAALAEPGASYDLSSMFVISSGGAIFSEAVKQELRAQLPKTLLIDAFGASEVGHQGMNLGANETGKPRFIVDASTAVLDDDLKPIEPGSGVVGRVARRGRMPIGYYKDEAKTASTFMVDGNGVRWVIPGDRATVEADGSITLLGRGSVCINSGGEKIYPEEVEAALKSHDAIFDAVVVGVPDDRWGERVAAVVQLRPGHALTLPELDAHARMKVSAYKVPRQLTIVEEVLRSPSGKADYRWAKTIAVGGAG